MDPALRRIWVGIGPTYTEGHNSISALAHVSMLSLDMAGDDCRGPCAEAYGKEYDGSISPDQDQMTSFLDLETSTTSSFPLDDADCDYPDSCETSFLLSSPGTSVEALMEENAKAAATTHDHSGGSCAGRTSAATRDGADANTVAAPHSAPTTIATRASSGDSFPRSSQRHSLLEPARRHLQKLRLKDGDTHQDDGAEYSDRSPQRRPRSSLLLLDTYMQNLPKPSTEDDQRRDESQSRHSQLSDRSNSLDRYSSMTRAEFDALPPTIQRKVSPCFYSSTNTCVLSTGGKVAKSEALEKSQVVRTASAEDHIASWRKAKQTLLTSPRCKRGKSNESCRLTTDGTLPPPLYAPTPSFLGFIFFLFC